jgi:NAD(P)H-flavin reductase
MILNVAANTVEAERQRLLRLDGPVPGHGRHGQYTRLRVGDVEGWFAIASAPGEPGSFLIKRPGAAAEVVADLPVGASIEVDEARGGFVLPEAELPTVIFAAGSGIGAVRALAHAQPNARVYYGEKTVEHLAFAQDRTAWAAQGRLTVVLSAPGPGWGGPVGHVQDAAGRDGLNGRFIAVVCGPSSLAGEVAARWPEAVVVQNY